MQDTIVRTDAARVAVFAHTPVVAVGLADLLGATAGVHVVGSTTELGELGPLVIDNAAQIVVTELLNESESPTQVFDTIHGIDRLLGADVADVAVVCVIPSPAGFAMDLKRRGASAVVTMTDDPDVLRRAVVDATSTPALPPPAHRGAVELPTKPALTARELEVLQGMVDGYSSRVIAEELGVSVNTVRTHVQRLLPKLGAHNRLRAAAVAVELGLITPSTNRTRVSGF